MSATLPSGRNGLSCAPYGDSIYCFGGYDGTNYLNQIVRYIKKFSSPEPTIIYQPEECWLRIAGGGGSLLIAGGGGNLKIK
jgi:hypothetical protein